MAETQVHVITVKKEGLHSCGCDDEAYRCVKADIVVNEALEPRNQRIAVTHEVLGVYLGAIIDPDIITEIAEAIIDAEDQL